MRIAGKSVMVTGANRGIGAALVEEALRRGASRVYAGVRQPLTHPNPRPGHPQGLAHLGGRRHLQRHRNW